MALEVSTYADGFGVWHATVRDEDGPWGNGGEVRNLDREWSKIRRAGQRAIRREIQSRQALAVGRVRTEVEKLSDPTGTGLIYSVTVKEVVR